MKRLAIRSLALILATLSWPAVAQDASFSFAVVANAFRYGPDERTLRHVLDAVSTHAPAFVVVNGIKANQEACSDELYAQRKSLLEKTKLNLILSLGANDWATCQRSNGESAAIARLQRVREIFFTERRAVKEDRIPLVRQSTSEKFRSYSENQRWQVGSIMFATLNLPANNNHYLSAAGRNNEFEDRLVANQEWLQHVFVLAKANQTRGIVLFSEANPLARPLFDHDSGHGQRDGYLEIRRQLLQLSDDFRGKVLLVHNGKPSRWASLHKLDWRGNLGELGLLTGWAKISVHPRYPTLFLADLQAAEN